MITTVTISVHSLSNNLLACGWWWCRGDQKGNMFIMYYVYTLLLVLISAFLCAASKSKAPLYLMCKKKIKTFRQALIIKKTVWIQFIFCPQNKFINISLVSPSQVIAQLVNSKTLLMPFRQITFLSVPCEEKNPRASKISQSNSWNF